MLQTLEIVGSVLFVVQAAIPLLQYLAKLTATKADDSAVGTIATIVHDLLALIPAQRPGLSIENKELLKDAKAIASNPVVTGIHVDDVLHQ